MQSSARESYFVTEVMTATPQKLQLMLIEAAIRSAERARHQWQAEEYEQACESLIHAQQIVGELLAALDRKMDPELVKKVAAIYLFVLRSLMEANGPRDEKKLSDAIQVLQVERETWQMLCQQLGSARQPDAGAVVELRSQAAAAPPAPHLPGLSSGTSDFGDLPAAGISLEG